MNPRLQRDRCADRLLPTDAPPAVAEKAPGNWLARAGVRRSPVDLGNGVARQAPHHRSSAAASSARLCWRARVGQDRTETAILDDRSNLDLDTCLHFALGVIAPAAQKKLLTAATVAFTCTVHPHDFTLWVEHFLQQ